MTDLKITTPPVPTELVSLLHTVMGNFEDQTAMLVAADWCGENDHTSLEWLLRYLAGDGYGYELMATGSRVYGTPRTNSDFDWVLYVAGILPEEFKPLQLQATVDGLKGGDIGSYDAKGVDAVLRFDCVNLLCCTAEWQMAAWKKGNAILIRDRPVTRDKAVKEFERWRNHYSPEPSDRHDWSS